jgi:hypothetical protein
MASGTSQQHHISHLGSRLKIKINESPIICHLVAVSHLKTDKVRKTYIKYYIPLLLVGRDGWLLGVGAEGHGKAEAST